MIDCLTQKGYQVSVTPVPDPVRGAVILAEGIETPAHLAAARSIGATLGQGWHFGHPEPLLDEPDQRGVIEDLRIDPAALAPG